MKFFRYLGWPFRFLLAVPVVTIGSIVMVFILLLCRDREREWEDYADTTLGLVRWVNQSEE